MTIDIISLLKFSDEEFAKKLFFEGEIYMNTIKWFKQLESKDIGDKYEGTTTIKNIKNAKVTFHLPQPVHFKSNSIQLTEHLVGAIGNIYSTYAISNLLVKRKKVHKIDRRMSQFGNHCVLIKNVQKFQLLIFQKLDELGLEYSHHYVRYKNFSINDHKLNPYTKSHLLSYQKEHRIVAWSENDEPIKFKIGSIEKFAELYKTDKIIESLKVHRT